MRRTSPEIVGHRGYAARAPENTLASLDLALEAGVDALEWDVRVAACGTPVLFHDETLERTSDGQGPLADRTLGELRALDVGGWFSAAFEGERVPSLAEALEHVSGRVGRVYCEIKAAPAPEDVERIVEIVRSAGMLADAVFISLDWDIVERTARVDSAVDVGFILHHRASPGDATARVERLGRGLVAADARLLLAEPTAARTMVSAGIALGAWTVNDPVDAGALVAMGVGSLTTDEAGRLLAWRSERDAA